MILFASFGRCEFSLAASAFYKTNSPSDFPHLQSSDSQFRLRRRRTIGPRNEQLQSVSNTTQVFETKSCKLLPRR